MIPIPMVYSLFALGIVLFLLLGGRRPSSSAPRVAAIVYFTGMTLLPAEAYEGIEPGASITPWVIGVLIPTPFFVLNKAWIAGLAALAVAARLDPARLTRFRPGLVDLPIVLLCLWPVAQAAWFVADPNPPTHLIVALLAGTWAVPWFLGRIYFSQGGERRILVDDLILFSLILMPIIAIETTSTLRIHELLYGPHPFAIDGMRRYVGYRPVAFFEHGNQYGIWICAAAVAAWWRARFAEPLASRGGRWLLALLLIGMGLASQSVGAIMLMTVTLVWLECAAWLERHPWIYRLGVGSVGSTGLLLISGKLSPAALGLSPDRIAQIARLFETFGRGSLKWRVARALDNLPQAQTFLWGGRGRWDWYPSFRPWDMTMILIGYFGLVGLLLVVLVVTAGVYRPARVPPAPRLSSRYIALALVGMAVGDGLMNTFVFLPALVLLGSLPQGHRQPARRTDTAEPEAEEAVR